MSDKITTIIDYLASSVVNNEVTDVERLTLALNELENFSMTFEILDSSRVGQILQSIRHSKQITAFISERIRFLIKCWRQLLNVDILNIIPSKLQSNLSKTPVVKNGYTNGYIRDPQNSEKDLQINGVNHIESKIQDNTLSHGKSPTHQEENNEQECDEVVIVEDQSSERESSVRLRNQSDSSKLDENLISQNESQHIPYCHHIKPKLKSTKDLLADFSNFIENDTKNKILMDKISQEDDEPTSYCPQDFKVKEMIKVSILQQERNNRNLRHNLRPMKRKRSDSFERDIELVELEEEVPHLSKCQSLLKQFQDMCSHQPKVVLKQFIPWTNLKRGLQLHPPEIKVPLSERKLLRTMSVNSTKCSVSERKVINTTYTSSKSLISVNNSIPPILENTSNSLSMNVIDNLLESFEVRAKQKQMISEAIQQRKQQTKIIDNTISIVDVSMKLKLKIPKVPILKLRRKKKKKKKKKTKPKPIKIKIKKPRKPYIRPMPPITNYLDDIPILPSLPNNICFTQSLEVTERQIIDCTEENVNKLAYGVFEGYNCTKHTQNSSLIQLTGMYSNVIGQHYLHIFPWVDVLYSTPSTFPINSDELLKSLTKVPDFYS